jgi:hypothetical protein
LFLLSWRNSPVGRKNFEVPTPRRDFIFLPREAEAAAIRFEAGAHGDISARAFLAERLIKQAKRSAKSVAARF